MKSYREKVQSTAVEPVQGIMGELTCVSNVDLSSLKYESPATPSIFYLTVTTAYWFPVAILFYIVVCSIWK